MARLVSLNKSTADRLADNTALRWLGRFGDVCYGVVHVVVAVLALRVAFGKPASELDQRGAITAIAAAPFGIVLLWMIAIGLLAFGVWQLLAAAVSYGWIKGRGRRIRKRIGVFARAAAVLAVAVLTLRLIFAAPTRSESSRQRDWTAQLLGLPGGQVLVVVVGLAVIAGAVVLGWRGVTRSFLADLDARRLRGRTRTTVGWLGTCGYLAKGVAFAIVGILVVVAGVQADPARSGGLDTALRALANRSSGDLLLVIVSLGLIGYGGYLAAEARYRRNR